MSRKPNTNRDGRTWSEDQKRKVWNDGGVSILGLPVNEWKNDRCGKRMKYSEHGNRNSIHGWEIDHINPVSNGGSDEYINLQPLHWKNNLDKADKRFWSCP
ncbi:HNH endonuclease signature motif containing protein [Aquimarina sp. 2304DJ70-9]|uniref:HNH endonuclease signature motif containing protein n=1 Tax=Aquimarina penaris TaxID=3231044 RepID=UPI00346263AE